MPVLQLVTQLLAARRLAQLVRGLAPTLAEPVQKSLSQRVGSMPRAEARGYIRAKTTPVVQFELALREPRLSTLNRQALAAELTERIVQLVLEDVVRGRTQRVPGRAAA